MATQRFDGDVSILGNLQASGRITGSIDRSQLVGEYFYVPLYADRWKVWDAFQTPIATPASDDLGLTTGVWATGFPYVSTGDLKAAGSTTRRARQLVKVHQNFIVQNRIILRLNAGMVTTVSDNTATIDVEAFLCDNTTSLISGADLVTTAAQDINHLGMQTKDFEIDPTTINPYDLLDIRLSITVNDAATATAVIGAVVAANLLCYSK